MSNLRDRLKSEATEVRRFLEGEGRELSDFFRNFPIGACGNASDLLGEWIMEKHSLALEYVNGDRNGKSHGWLEIDGLAVDITSDQFPDGLGGVYCGELNDFFSSFKAQVRSTPVVSPMLKPVYTAMKSALETDYR